MGALSAAGGPESISEEESIRVLRELIRAFFPDYLHLVESDASALLDLDRLAFSRVPPEEATLVARIPARKGNEVVTVLVRIEIESPAPAEAAESMVRTLRALRVPYGKPVLATLLSLRGGRPGVSLEAGPLAQLSGIELGRIFFTTFCLSGANAEFFLERPEPLAWILSTLMRPARRAVTEHAEVCRNKIAAAPVTPRQRALILRSLEALSHLSPSAPRPWATRSSPRTGPSSPQSDGPSPRSIST